MATAGISLIDYSSSGQLITLRSGINFQSIHSSGGDLQDKLKIALFNGMFNALSDAAKVFVKDLAKRTGDLRTYIMFAIVNEINSQRGSSVITFDFDMAVRIASQIRDYINFHYEQGSQFRFQGGYQKPTTPGTIPIDFNNFKSEFDAIWQSELKKALIRQGFQVA